MKDKFTLRTVALLLAIVLIGIVSFTVLGDYFSSPETYSKTIEILDEKRNNVTGMSGVAIASSAGLAALPGDATTPVANELANLATTCMVIVVAIIFQKYLLVLSGMFTFKVLVPVACVLLIAFIWTKREILAKMAAKLVLFGLCFVLLVPVSTQVISVIDQTHQISAQQNLEDAEKFADDLKASVGEDESSVKKFVNKFAGGLKGIKERAEAIFGNLIDAIAIMIITSCIIPLITLWGMLWLAKTLLGVQIRVPMDKIKSIARSGSKARKKLTEPKENSNI